MLPTTIRMTKAMPPMGAQRSKRLISSTPAASFECAGAGFVLVCMEFLQGLSGWEDHRSACRHRIAPGSVTGLSSPAEVAGVANAPHGSLASRVSMSAAEPRLLGRISECAALDALLASVRAGPSRALV